MKGKLQKSADLFPVVGIGASAGGFTAFKEFLKAIPESSGIAYVLVQHLHPDHDSILADLLQKVTTIPVLEITDKINVQPDHIYVIPSNHMLIANDGELQLSLRPTKDKHERNMPIDLFFASLAEVHESDAIGILLSGTGSDGTRGLKAIKDRGGLTLAQTEASAEYGDMAANAVRAGVVDFTLSPEEMPGKLIEVTRTISEKEKASSGNGRDILSQILSLLRTCKGTDFTYYKQTTVHRRIVRRMAITKVETLSQYLKYLRANKSEQDTLYQDMLIPVTGFFRDKTIFDRLCESWFPKMITNRQGSQPLRIWIAGCSTGEEAYSVAICFRELLGERRDKVQIFATDISEPALAKARSGLYSKNELDGISPQRVQEFFTKTNGHYSVKKEVRNMCVFALHNFLKDPPFGKLDFISCRNVLIYLDPYLQKKALTTFHYALNPKGHLLLGKSETGNSMPDLFMPASKQDKMFIRKDVPGRFMRVASDRREKRFRVESEPQKSDSPKVDFKKAADEVLLVNYTPVGVVVNESMDIVYYRGNANTYLEQATGKPTHNLLKLAREGLAFELRNILYKTKNDPPVNKAKKQSVKKENVPVTIDGRTIMVTIEVIPLPNTIDPHYLILFHDQKEKNRLVKSRGKTTGPTPEETEKDRRINLLEQELTQIRIDLGSITEEQEAANEELESANEELESANEELQSLNEELETSKEEMQSANEELTVLNHELANLNEQVTASRNFAEAIIATVREPLLVLDKKFQVQVANNSFYKNFQVDERETEGRLVFDLGDKQWDIPDLRRLLEELTEGREAFSEFEVQHQFPNIGERVMLLNAREMIREPGIDNLILLSIEDITERKKAALQLEASEKRFKNMFLESPYAFAILKGPDMIVHIANKAMEEVWGKGPSLEGKRLLDILPEIESQGFPEILLKVYQTGVPHYGHETFVRLRRREVWDEVYFNFVYQAYREVDGTISGVVIIANEVTIQAELNKKVRESEEQFHQLANLLSTKIINADIAGNYVYINQNWLDYTGMSLNELKDSGWRTVLHPDEQSEIVARWKRLVETGEAFEMEHRCKDKAQEYKWHLSRLTPVKDDGGKISRWIGATTEIHKLKLAEQQKEDFLKLASHELKTPVTSIKGYLQLLLSLPPEEAELSVINDYISRVDRQVSRLIRLISEILDVSRINEGSLELQKEQFKLSDLIAETVEDIQVANSRYTINLANEFSAEVYADRDRIGQVIINLINNAIKYSTRNFRVDVRTYRDERNHVAVSIKDYGIGIKKADHEKIFQRFYRVAGKSERSYAGFGIGLFLATEIISRHEGTMRVESEEGLGSTFTFTLPYKSEVEEAT